MELTKTKLHKILKKYRAKQESLNKEWLELCKRKCNYKDDGDMISITTPSIYDHEKHNAKAGRLFNELLAEFDNYEVFPSRNKP